jgi:hypothetical protein
MKISPNCFYQMSIRESSLAVNGHFKAVERDYNLAFMASYNANGAIQGGKKFKILLIRKNNKQRKNQQKKNAIRLLNG